MTFRDILEGIQCNWEADGPEDVASGLHAPPLNCMCHLKKNGVYLLPASGCCTWRGERIQESHQGITCLLPLLIADGTAIALRVEYTSGGAHCGLFSTRYHVQ